MNNRLEGQMMLFSHQYPGALFTEVTPPQQGLYSYYSAQHFSTIYSFCIFNMIFDTLLI